MSRSGQALDKSEVEQIIRLLTTTDMTIGAIALRMGCARNTVLGINKRYSIRDYAEKRTAWVLRRLQEEQ